MRRSEVETWTLRVLEQVRAGRRPEDDRVELKREWPPAAKAARRIAGHANSLRGEPALWIIGVDEKAAEIVGADTAGVESWWESIQQEFDRIAPDIQVVLVPTGETAVVALHFTTDRAPFVVRNPAYGQQAGDVVSHDIPWRDGTRVRSARRDEVLRLLLPTQQLPDVEVIDVDGLDERTTAVDAASVGSGAVGTARNVRLTITLYGVPALNQTVTIPLHTTSATLAFHDAVNAQLGVVHARHIEILGDGGRGPAGQPPGEVVLTRPGRITVHASFILPAPIAGSVAGARFALDLRPVHAERPVSIGVMLMRVPPPEESMHGAWGAALPRRPWEQDAS